MEIQQGFTHQSNTCLVEQVVTIICKYLPVQDIKNARLISKVWNYGASYRLKEVTRLYLDFDHKNFDLNLIKQQLNFRPHHVTILVRGLTPMKGGLPCQPEVLVPSGLNLKSLWITGFARSNMKDVEVLIVGEIFAKSYTTLEEIKYYGYIWPKFGEEVVFKKVKRLAIRSLHWGQLSHVSQIFLNTCPNLERLEMDYSGRSLWKKNPTHFPGSLTSLIFTTEFLQDTWISKNFAQRLLNFPNPLRVLHFYQYFDETDPEPWFFRLLHKHHGTLTDLGVTLTGYSPDLVLPPLPVLESLDISTRGDYDVWWADEVNPTERVDYSKFLPKLARLHLKCGAGVESFDLLDSFVPNELKDYVGPECRTVREVFIQENPETPETLMERLYQYGFLRRVWPEAEIKWHTVFKTTPINMDT
ncbi:uncharacterized protein LOC110854649 [Folsomia candida]|uniref:F-box domain-containing protein n=1 Tax=Folsomia candida TaxID=158441 RepID=A0A226DYT3_FOLCA|nr:uncharacterized protein LOC110854649 [Folsomia candida]XP_035711227.1 uncharacterized protein LOC110854649 [Folsomia candida]OXA49851.1 hypothetical protein Fcan01_15374 [Folsomia candida]